MTAAFFVLLREPGAWQNQHVERRQPSDPAVLHVLPTQRAVGEGPESHLGLLSFTAFTEKTLVPLHYVAQTEAQEKANKRGAALTHHEPLLRLLLRFSFTRIPGDRRLIDSSQNAAPAAPEVRMKKKNSPVCHIRRPGRGQNSQPGRQLINC